MHNRTSGNEAQTRTYTNALVPSPAVMNDDDEDMSFGAEEQEPELNTQEEREKFWQEVCRPFACSEGVVRFSPTHSPRWAAREGP
jgi:hypothetical protein